ncbi:S-adenosyl-L-methionine-dependent methyltransferase [Cadophora sp. DSE1049]|nr:S-adenosyl-L-methionine-dependent methyltransferase [Cadophora sp. DSE1049]
MQYFRSNLTQVKTSLKLQASFTNNRNLATGIAFPMSTQGSLAGLKVFEALNIEYENAYADNEIKKSCITHAISLLPPFSKVLDVGCGTGIPVSSMLSKASLFVIGFDISPKMIALAKSRVKGDFSVSDMLSYTPTGKFAGVFMIFAHMRLSYRDFHAAVFKFASVLQPGGILVLGQVPSDSYVKNESVEMNSYVEGYDVPFMGDMVPIMMMSAEGQRHFLTSMGLEIVWERIDTFQPKNEKCKPEEQQYIIARKPNTNVLQPRPLPDTDLLGSGGI